MSRPIVRVTQIEAFRRFIHNSEYDRYQITEQSVIDSITGQFRGNEYTRIGTAFHKVVEEGDYSLPYNPDTHGYDIDIDGNIVKFTMEQARVALNYRDEHWGAFHEVRRYKDYGRAIVTGCADMIDGIELRDIKTKYSTPSDKDYIDSCQWRYYLDIFGADVFHFDLFIFEGYKIDKHGYDVRGLELKRYTPPITCYRYPEMEAENLALLNEFMDFAESRNLIKYLKFQCDNMMLG